MNDIDKNLVVEILNVFQEKYKTIDVSFLSLETLISWLNPKQRELINTIVGLKPLEIRQASLAEEYSQPETVCSEPSDADSKQKVFVRIPKNIDIAFIKMRDGCKEDTGQAIYIESGYRSIAYQVILFLRELYDHNFDLNNTLMAIMPPKYSEHCQLHNPAIDISAENNGLGDTVFMQLVYPWMVNNANNYGFVETYTKDNGVMIWEPWHWRLGI